jgi:DNA-binding beta-propeller fold protein YncE
MLRLTPGPKFSALTALALLLAGCGHDHDFDGYYVPVSPILLALPYETTIGSVIDPANGGDLNPHGLAIAPVSIGPVTQGDLIVCNFNDGATNTQGQGTTIVGLSPTKGATPYTIAQSPLLKGCSEVAVLPDGNIVAAANVANDVVLVTPQGTPGHPSAGVISQPFSSDTFSGPWGLVFAAEPNGNALYVTNSGTGTIDRIALTSTDTQASFTEIASGFSVNGGAPGSILAPAGLTYDPSIDTLYVVDSNANRVVSIDAVSRIGTDGVVVTGTSFSGASATDVGIVASGSPLNGPISSALLYSGNLVVGNTLDPNGTNLLLELVPDYGFFGTRNVDVDQAGAIFGIATAGTNAGNQAIFFNDDNDSSVKVLSN